MTSSFRDRIKCVDSLRLLSRATSEMNKKKKTTWIRVIFHAIRHHHAPPVTERNWRGSACRASDPFNCHRCARFYWKLLPKWVLSLKWIQKNWIICNAIGHRSNESPLLFQWYHATMKSTPDFDRSLGRLNLERNANRRNYLFFFCFVHSVILPKTSEFCDNRTRVWLSCSTNARIHLKWTHKLIVPRMDDRMRCLSAIRNTFIIQSRSPSQWPSAAVKNVVPVGLLRVSCIRSLTAWTIARLKRAKTKR